jgi:uncharacterized membrane protein
MTLAVAAFLSIRNGAEMATQYPSGSGSFVSIKGHPIHPMLIPFPITFLVSAFLTDLAHLFERASPFWPQASLWLLGAGVVSGVFAGLTGALEAVKVRRARKLAITWIHGGANVVALLAAAINWVLRWGDPALPIIPTGFALSGCVVLILGFTAWLGGELSFRHGVGVSTSVGGVAGPGADASMLPPVERRP